MKITEIKTTCLRIPLKQFFYNSENAGTKLEWNGRRSRVTPKRPTPILEYVLIHIDTDEGISGIGEAPSDIGFFGQTMEEIKYAVEDYLGPQLVGKDPFDREYLLGLINYRQNSCAKAGIDMALHDLMGKAVGVPVCKLIGGAFKKRIPFAVEIPGGSPDDMAGECVKYMEQGVRAFKPKIGSIPEKDADRLRAIREAVGPDVSMRADANQGYSPKEAIKLCRLADKYEVGLEILEQPVPCWDLQGMALVRNSVDTLIEADESCFSIHDAMQVIRHEAADVLNVKIGKAGGLYNAKKIVALAEAAGLECVLGTAFGTGIEQAAKLHLAASTSKMADAVEFTEIGIHGSLLTAPHDKSMALPLTDGCLPVPDGPGLGVELDPKELEKYSYKMD